MYRFLNPKSEIRVAAGREIHFRQMQILLFYVANSIFVDGYLNTKGTDIPNTIQLLEDGGFTIKSETPIEKIKADYGLATSVKGYSETKSLEMKKLKDLKPTVCGLG